MDGIVKKDLALSAELIVELLDVCWFQSYSSLSKHIHDKRIIASWMLFLPILRTQLLQKQSTND